MSTPSVCEFVRLSSDEELWQVLYEQAPIVGNIGAVHLLGLDDHLIICVECSRRARELRQKKVRARSADERSVAQSWFENSANPEPSALP